jgi:hypothetical protein
MRPRRSTYLDLYLSDVKRLWLVSKAQQALWKFGVAYQIADNDLALSTGGTSGTSWSGPLHLLFALDGLLDSSNRSGSRRLGTGATATARMTRGLTALREDLVERLAQLVWHFAMVVMS